MIDVNHGFIDFVDVSLIVTTGQIPLIPANMKLFDPMQTDVIANLNCFDTLSPRLRSLLMEYVSPAPPAAAEHSKERFMHLTAAALNLLVQLTMCLRHAHRILQPLTSSLSKAVCCTVYVNTNPTGRSDVSQDPQQLQLHHVQLSCGLQEDALVHFVRRVMNYMETADGPRSREKCSKENIGGGDDADCEEDDVMDDAQLEKVRSWLAENNSF